MRHHPGEDLLFEYASGALTQGLSVVIASHLTLCPVCRHDVSIMEAVGGALMVQASDMAAVSVTPPLENETALAPEAAKSRIAGLPQPVTDLLTRKGNSILWRRVLPGLQECRVPLEGPRHSQLKLYKIRGGTAIPHHTHMGRELTLVLEGGFSDLTGHYGPGDMADADASVQHRPVADLGEECICLAAITAPLRLSGFWGRFVPTIW